MIRASCLGMFFCCWASPLAANEPPQVVHVGTVAPDVIGITIQAGRIEYGRQIPYTRMTGDEIREEGHERSVYRDGRFLGWLVGAEGLLIYTEDRLIGQPLDAAAANPCNVCYTTGLGHDSPQHPLHIDSRITHQAPPPGLTVFGPADVQNEKDNWAQKIVARFCYPDVQQWPTLEAFWDVFWYPSICEFTVQSPMAANAYVWGYLAARKP